jgi:hypothetical protein
MTDNYTKVREEAQARANRLGIAVGLQWDAFTQRWTTFLLPKPENRTGRELRCEVVEPENGRKA